MIIPGENHNISPLACYNFLMTEINLTNSWPDRVYQEINRAVEARGKGNEGMARVCARRAAGYIAMTYYRNNNGHEISSSAYGNLVALAAEEKLPFTTREKISHFLITVNKEHQLPDSIDLIADVAWLVEHL
jgi:hypothetical protein